MSENKVTVEELDGLINQLAEKEQTKDKMTKFLSDCNKEIASLESTITKYLKELGREDYSHPLAKKPLRLKQIWRVNMPKDDDAKRALFEHLREREIFDHYATVNSNSLNALYFRDFEQAKIEGRGMEFSMPGISAPTLFEKLDFKLKNQGEGDERSDD